MVGVQRPAFVHTLVRHQCYRHSVFDLSGSLERGGDYVSNTLWGATVDGRNPAPPWMIEVIMG